MDSDTGGPWPMDEGPGPDMLRGYDCAGESFTQVLADAEKRLLLTPDNVLGLKARLTDVLVWTQPRHDYEDPQEKKRVIAAAERVLDEAFDRETETARHRFDEALAALTREEERVFVAVLHGSVHDFVYWDWRYGYTIDASVTTPGRKRFRRDARYRKVAPPGLAARRYGNAVIRRATGSHQ